MNQAVEIGKAESRKKIFEELQKARGRFATTSPVCI